MNIITDFYFFYQVEFRQALTDVKTKLKTRPADTELLILYGLFKQSLLGDNTTVKPGIFDMKGRYKWDAWTKNKGMSKEEAQTKYIEHVAHLKSKYS